MDPEICDYFEPISKKNKLCKYYVGNINDQRQINKCKYNCNIMESKGLMDEEQVLERRRGAFRRK